MERSHKRKYLAEAFIWNSRRDSCDFLKLAVRLAHELDVELQNMGAYPRHSAEDGAAASSLQFLIMPSPFFGTISNTKSGQISKYLKSKDLSVKEIDGIAG
jgi:hypothetical protein